MADRDEVVERTLIERLEAAAEGSRELDAEIAVAAHFKLPKPMGECSASLRVPHSSDGCAPGTYWVVQLSGMSLRTAPHFSTSLDAALSLVPEGFRRMDIMIVENGPAYIAYNGVFYDCEAATPALALCTAALKARESDDGR